MARTELISTQSSTAFDRAVETVRGLLAQVARDESETRHRIGLLLREISHSSGTYGARAVERLAERLEVGADTLYRCIVVAESWSSAELKVLLSRCNRRGEPLTWSHLVILARVPGGAAREKWVSRCLDAGWSTRELGQQMLGGREAPVVGPGPGGRVVSVNSVGVALTECVQNASRAKLKMRVAVEAIQDRLRDGDEVDEMLVERAIREHEELREATELALACLRQTSRASSVRIRIAPNVAPTGRSTANGSTRPSK